MIHEAVFHMNNGLSRNGLLDLVPGTLGTEVSRKAQRTLLCPDEVLDPNLEFLGSIC